MDPTIKLCEVRDSFTEVPLTPELPPAFHLSEAERNSTPIFEVTTADGITYTPPIAFASEDRYVTLQALKDQYENPRFEEARNKTNPFEFLGNSIFLNRAAVKLANLDAIYNVSQHQGGFINFQTRGHFTFCDIAAGPGSFTQYLQWRRPEAVGHGVTLRGPLDWNLSVIDTKRFIPYYGPDNTGDLYVNWRPFVETVTTQYPTGVDLVTGDGGFDVDKGQYNRQEYLSSRLILTECLVALLVLKTGGDFVCKMFDTVEKISADTLYIMARCFEEITLFKPCSSRPANAERYLICRAKRANIQNEVDLLVHATEYYEPNIMVTGFLREVAPSFSEWLYRENMASIERQISLAQKIISLMSATSETEVGPRYDIHKCFLYWNIPDNPIGRRSQIKVYN